MSWVRAFQELGAVLVSGQVIDPGSAHLILKVDHCGLNLICSPLFQM